MILLTDRNRKHNLIVKGVDKHTKNNVVLHRHRTVTAGEKSVRFRYFEDEFDDYLAGGRVGVIVVR